jgi:hypothetical protein
MNDNANNPVCKNPDSTGSANLLPQHLEELRRSGLSDEQIRECRFRSETDPRTWSKLLNWKSPPKDAGPVLCIPFYGADGKYLNYVRVKPDKPRKAKNEGKPIKYESAKGAANRAYIPPGTRAALADVSKPLILTEGEKKAAKADQEGFACIGLVGVYGWQKARSKNDDGRGTGPRDLIPDLATVAWTGRPVFIAFDSDIVVKVQVTWAQWHLAEALTKAGAAVLALRIPAAADGSKQGLDDFLKNAGVHAFEDLLKAAVPVEKPERQSNRVPILISTDEYQVNEAACNALKLEADLYKRGGMLVQIVETDVVDEAGAMIRRPAGSLVVRAVAPANLRERLTRCARWQKWNGAGDNARVMPAHPPPWAVNAIHGRGDWPGVRRLDAVVTHPVLLPDGSILATPGYDPTSRLYASLPTWLTLKIPERPGKADVTAALATLADVLRDFPFLNASYRSAWLAGLLTPLAFFAFEGPSPLFLIDSNVRGVGKGLLADVIALIVSGQRFPTMSYTNDKEELRKQITSLAVEGATSVLLDNLAGPVGNDVFDRALTSDRWKDRLLGGNRVYDGPLDLVWYATGNNVQLHADTARRVCHICLETEDERPETKTGFKFTNLREHVRQNRGSLLSAALTILRAWIVAGKPKHGLPNWGSFEEWSSLVREVIVFAGLSDPGETRQALQSSADREAAAMTAILQGMLQFDETRRGLTAADVISKLKNLSDDAPDWQTETRSAVEELCGRIDGHLLAYKLRHFKRRTFAGGLRLDDAGQSRGSNRWVVRRLKEGPGIGRRDDHDASTSSLNEPRVS